MEVLKDRIHTIENGKQIISPEDFLHQILNSLPNQYDGLAEQLQQDINRKDDYKLTIIRMIDQLGLKYAKLRMNKKNSDTNSDEMALVGYNQFKGKCNFCGKIGHKLVDCWDRKKSPDKKKNSKKGTHEKKGTFVPKCYNCGEMGHKQPDCPKLKKKNENSSAFIAVDEEVAFPCMDIQDGWIPVTYKKKSPNKIGTILKNEQVRLKFRSNRIQTDKITTTKVSKCQPKTKSPVENEVIKPTSGSENPALSGKFVGDRFSLESKLKKILGMESTETNEETNSEGEDD